MNRLLRDCTVVLLVVGSVYYWKYRPVPEPVAIPAIPGEMPDLRMPSAPRLRTRRATDSATLVVHELAGNERPRLAGGKSDRERALGGKSRVLGGSAVDATAASGPDGVLDDERSPWEDRLRQPWAVGAVVALFVVLYALGVRALRRGPGGGGFTHD